MLLPKKMKHFIKSMMKRIAGFVLGKMASTSHEPSYIEDYANWMAQLPDGLISMPLYLIAIPGSHDTFSYSISRKYGISPDDPDLQFLNKIPCVGSVAKRVVRRWSVTQGVTCYKQLTLGLRYLDFRAAPNPVTGEICFIHGLYGTSTGEAFAEIIRFLDAHPKEIIFLDIQHMYSFTQEIHESLIAEIIGVFGSLLCPFTSDLETVTIKWMWRNDYRVFVFYRNSCSYQHPNLWPSNYIPNPWPNTPRVNAMVDFLESKYQAGRPGNKFYVTQGILTPDNRCVALHLCSSLKSVLVGPANNAISNWLKDKRSGLNGINIVIVDFADMNPELVKQVIALNFRAESQRNLGFKAEKIIAVNLEE